MSWNPAKCKEAHTGQYGQGLITETCSPTSCAKCGWNPKIEAARKKIIRDQTARGETPHAPKTIRDGDECVYGHSWRCRTCLAKSACDKYVRVTA